MATFILVPGAMHGAWTWDRVRPHLEAAGHRVVAEDLPGMASRAGDPAAEDVTLALWGEAVADLVRAAEGPVILAAHSRGGLVIGEAAQRVAERIAGLIYVTALLVPPGMTGREASGVSPAEPGEQPMLADLKLPPDVARQLFYQRCTPEDADWAIARLCAEPSRPLRDPATVSWDRWGRVPRAFIACSDDRVLTPERQAAMLAAVPCDPVVTLDSDHSPFLHKPEELADAMLRMAEGFLKAH